MFGARKAFPCSLRACDSTLRVWWLPVSTAAAGQTQP